MKKSKSFLILKIGMKQNNLKGFQLKTDTAKDILEKFWKRIDR